MDALNPLVRDALVLTAMLCLPLLVAVTAIGTAVAVLQAATQVQEQTLTLLPKLLVAGLTVAACGAFALRACAALFSDAIVALPQIVRGS
jgi:flagellar biosynthetic protein FliQ